MRDADEGAADQGDAMEPEVRIVDSTRRAVAMSRQGVEGLDKLPTAEVTALLRESGVDLREIAMEVFDAAITEESTDRFIDVVVPLVPLPWWLRWFPLRSILDSMLPGTLRRGLVALLY